jgi:hypothetical protein
LNASFPSLATTTPFAIPSPSSFRSTLGPPALTSAQYAADFLEVKRVGEATSATRTADQTESARFWAGTAIGLWNRAAAASADARHNTLSENARLFAVLNVAIADALISCWDAKYHFVFWRPITAIRLANTDGNDATDVQATWTPLITTPAYPDYDSGHQSVSGSAQAILTAFFGSMPVQGISEGSPASCDHFQASPPRLTRRSWRASGRASTSERPCEMHEPGRSTLRRTCSSTLPSERMGEAINCT